MGLHRKSLREKFQRNLDSCSDCVGFVELKVKIGRERRVLLLRRGNHADYLVGGELVWGAYFPPKAKPTRIVDGGANIGMFSVLASGYFPDVPIVCYEPDGENVSHLKRNLELNKIRAEVFSKGLWSSDRTLYFHPADSYTGHVSESPSRFPIECVAAKVENGCWLKLDIEGAEYEVLPEILRRGLRPGFISMEIHFNNEKGGLLISILEECGYRLRRPYDAYAECLNIEADYFG
jgi:FkbM family methyltransferase